MFRTLTTLALALALAAGASALPAARAAGEPEPLAGPAVERFALYADAEGHERGASEVLGLVEWRRRSVLGGMQLQREVRFVDAGRDAGRVVHVERLTERDARFVWREIGTASGRSLCVEWTRDGRGLMAFEWGRDGARRVKLEAWKGVALPLYLIELARSGGATQGNYVTFDPLGRRLESVELSTSYRLSRATEGTLAAPRSAATETAGARARAVRPGPWSETEPALATEAGAASEAVGAPRTVELRRGDGTLCGRYEFRGTELVAFQLQSGGPIARRVSHSTYSRILNGLKAADAERR